MFGMKRRRRERYRRRPWPPEWRRIVDRNVPYVRTLSSTEIRALDGLVQIFLGEKRFEGCGGLEVTDEMRVTIAVHACLLQLHREGDCYPGLHAILVYPHAYVAHAVHRQPDGTVLEGPQARLGESWSRGSVVVSWDDVLHGAWDFHDGHNVVLHEFAHQLDAETGAVNGAPRLPMRSRYATWAHVLGDTYEALIDDLSRHHHTLLGPYAATSPAEFFAVATEIFFERPVALSRRHPALYRQLALFYNQDPAARARSEQVSDQTGDASPPE